MDKSEYDRFESNVDDLLDAMARIVKHPPFASWEESAAAILDNVNCCDNGTSFHEFMSWFDATTE